MENNYKLVSDKKGQLMQMIPVMLASLPWDLSIL